MRIFLPENRFERISWTAFNEVWTFGLDTSVPKEFTRFPHP
jgi:hypothetical protein